jgi:hypothetical protein
MTFTTQTRVGVAAIKAVTSAVQQEATAANTGGVGFL